MLGSYQPFAFTGYAADAETGQRGMEVLKRLWRIWEGGRQQGGIHG
jgi:hypothetical protein